MTRLLASANLGSIDHWSARLQSKHIQQLICVECRLSRSSFKSIALSRLSVVARESVKICLTEGSDNNDVHSPWVARFSCTQTGQT
jgi:hypothetical protein